MPILIAAAAARWGVAPESCTTGKSAVRHDASNRKLAYRDLVSRAVSTVSALATSELEPAVAAEIENALLSAVGEAFNNVANPNGLLYGLTAQDWKT